MQVYENRDGVCLIHQAKYQAHYEYLLQIIFTKMCIASSFIIVPKYLVISSVKLINKCDIPIQCDII